MGPSGSTLRGHPNCGTAGAHPLAAPGLSDCPPGELVALLLPMVRRGIRTACGPVALVRWLQQRGVPQEPAARRVTEDLVRALFDPIDTLGGTLTDSRRHEGQPTAAS